MHKQLIASSAKPGPAINSLVRRLEAFYQTYTEYTAFTEPDNQRTWLELIEHELKERLAYSSRVKMLEAGAGLGSVLSGLSQSHREKVEYTAQDITEIGAERRASVADKVHCGPLESLDETFDLIYSMFVLEHIPKPAEFLATVDRLLRPGGTHLVICPRYDFPGYVCPSLRHLSFAPLVQIEAERFVANARNQISRREPIFWVNSDPALFHHKWRRDADAVHIVSKSTVVAWHRRRGYKSRNLYPRTRGIRDRFMKRSLILSTAFDKAPSLREFLPST